MATYHFYLVDQTRTDVSWPRDCSSAEEALAHARYTADELAQDDEYLGFHITVADNAGTEIGRVGIGTPN